MYQIMLNCIYCVYTSEKRGVIMNVNNHEGVYPMTTTAQKWGNSIGVRIPQKVAQKFDIVNGSKIEVFAGEDGIIIKPINKKPTLDELLSQITDNNRHEFIDFGRKGNELI